MDFLKQHVNKIIISLLVLTNISLMLFLSHKPSTATFDIKSTAHSFAVQLAGNKKLSNEQKMDLSKQFAKVSKEDIDEYANKHNVIILARSSTLGTSNDITPKLQKKIAQSMQDLKK